jgi:hypothetical protein
LQSNHSSRQISQGCSSISVQIDLWPYRLLGERRHDLARRCAILINLISEIITHGDMKNQQEKYQERLADFESTSFIVLSDLWLDHPRALEGFRRVLDGCVEHDFIPFAFVLCGNFATRKVDTSTTEGQTQYAGMLTWRAVLMS